MIGSHIIPRFYLEQFATKKKPNAKTGHFWVYAKGSPAREGTPKSEGVENGYFGIPTETGELDESLEAKLAEMENEAADVLTMAGYETFAWSLFYRQRMAKYAALLFARTKARRDGSAWVSDVTAKEMPQLAANDELVWQLAKNLADIVGRPVEIEMVRESMLRTAEKMKDKERKRVAFLGEVFQSADAISEILLKKPWQVWSAPDNEEFVTSDNPLVTLLPVREGVFAPGNGFDVNNVLTAFPLNPKRCLTVGANGRPFTTVSALTVEGVNEVQIRCMFQNVYSRTKSDKVEQVVNEYGATTRFGENAFLMLGDYLPKMATEFARLMQAQRDKAVRQKLL